MKRNTRHFKNCLGVFQGGGCKALAFVGAYKEAVDRGVFFSGVAGTSAGSVIAALIAAGATPEDLESAVSNTDFKTFKQLPQKGITPADASWSRHFLSCSWKKRHRAAARFMRHLGLFSSVKIEEWLEEKLRAFLGFSDSRPVQFKDLCIPLHVVATDLRGAKPIIWSSETTPDFSVARAVRCSCTIPIYFQPVDSFYVDGGLVSNLPSFVLNGRSAGQFEKLLCFTFSPDQVPQALPYTGNRPLIQDYVKSLISAFIDGAVHIQSELQPNLHVIEIGKLPLGTVDFEKVSRESVQLMLSAGQKAAELFFDSEVLHVRSAGAARPVLHTETEALNHIVREELNKGDEVFIALKSTRNVYNLFPTFLHWSMTGVGVTYLCEPAPGSGWAGEHEPFQRLVLRGLGARVVEVPSIPFEGVLFKRQSSEEDMIVFDEHRGDENSACFAVKYEKTFDSAAIHSMSASLTKCLSAPISGYDDVQTKVTIEKGGHDELFKRLKMVRQYAAGDVTLSLEEVDVSKIVFLTKYVKSYKYNQIQRLFDMFMLHNAENFESMQVRCKSSRLDIVMPITPPVVEEQDGKLYLLEGNSRLTYLIKEKRVKKVKLVVVRYVDINLPSEGRFSPQQLLITDEGKIGKDRYKGFEPSLFRRIEEAVHSPALYKENYIG